MICTGHWRSWLSALTGSLQLIREDYLEADRSGLSAEISKLRKEGILESEKNRFTLLQ